MYKLQAYSSNTGITYTQSDWVNFRLGCGDSTTLTGYSDSVAFPYYQEVFIDPAATEVYFVFKDAINSLTENYPDADCFTETRRAQFNDEESPYYV